MKSLSFQMLASARAHLDHFFDQQINPRGWVWKTLSTLRMVFQDVFRIPHSCLRGRHKVIKNKHGWVIPRNVTPQIPSIATHLRTGLPHTGLINIPWPEPHLYAGCNRAEDTGASSSGGLYPQTRSDRAGKGSSPSKWYREY